MNITELVKKPQLIEIKIDDDDIVATYGETVTFWMSDYIDLNTYFDFYKHQAQENGDELMTTLRKLILNSEGKPVISEEEVLPTDLTIAALIRINSQLGKSKTKQSTGEIGTQPE
jgi:hypothetical protein